MKIGIIIQARLGSTRFPNKVLAPIYEKVTVIEEIIKRAKKVDYPNRIIIATSNCKSDDELVHYLGKKTDVEVFRGSEENVLSRFVLVAEKFELDHIVRLTGDNPCIDPKVVDDTIKKHLSDNFDYSYTIGYPLGMNIEIVSSAGLFVAFKDGCTQADREHVTFFIRNNPERFKLNFIQVDLQKEVKNLRLTFDTPSDYLQMQILFDYLKPKNSYFNIHDIVKLWQSKPYIFSINNRIHQKKIFKTRNAELMEAFNLLKKQEMRNAAEIIKNSLNE